MSKAPPDIKPLIEYFLNLFKIQIAGGEIGETEGGRAAVVSDKPGEDVIYELMFRYRDQIKSRRMSIRCLGEQVESKSMCYKVIYDDLLVIKIPPRPILEFQVYLDHIHREHAVAKRLLPGISCVYPHLGAILKKVPALRLPADTPGETAEQEYMSQLTRTPDLQRYLQIGDGFVFFMSLSRYAFFNQVIDSIHRSKDLIRQEILRNGPEAVSDFCAFETLYGACNSRVYFDMHGLIKSYEKSVDDVIRTSDVPVSLPDYQKQEWFFARIAGAQPETTAAELPPGLFEKIDTVTARTLNAGKPVIESFQKAVHATVQQKRFDANRARIKALAVNVIELLYRLKNRSVAIRDLKPDNMYVAAEIDGADHILSDPDAYDLGLIDLETAVCFTAEKNGRPVQPLLAGTPAYATPTHIFHNTILSAVYRSELPRIFYLQDWYAALVIIFYLVTGRLLFARTARLMPEISRIKKKNVRKAQVQLGVFQNCNRTFWKTATGEFGSQLEKHRDRLQDVEIDLPGHLREFLAAECAIEQRLLDTSAAALIDSCPGAGKYRDKLLTASHASICRIIDQQQGKGGSEKRGNSMLHLLSRVEPLKRRQQQLEKTAKRLGSPLACDTLLAFMFERVRGAMDR